MITINLRVRAILLVIVSIACTTNGQFLPSFEPRTIRPVIIVPGLEGSQLEVKLNKPSVVQSNCDRRTDDFSTIWVDITEMTPAKIDCFLDNMKLVYNSTTRKTSNAPGVETRSPGWGQTWAVEYMSRTLQIPQLRYMATMVNHFATRSLGTYQRGVNLKAAPYDFRRAPNEQQEWMNRLKSEIEETVMRSNGKKVVLIGHSMGCLFLHYFLVRQSTEWKSTFVQLYVPIGGPFGGAVEAVEAFATGHNVGVVPYANEEIRNLEVGFPSATFLLPSSLIFPANQVLVEVHNVKKSSLPGSGSEGSKGIEDPANSIVESSGAVGTLKITPSDFKTYFDLLNLPDAYQMWMDTRDLMGNLEHPKVDTVCITSSGIDTLEKLVYNDMTDFPLKPKLVNGGGDGVVNRISLEACTRWSSDPKYRFEHKDFPGLDHEGVINDGSSLEYLFDVVTRSG